ncbi:transposase [Streptomyces sp. NPDC090022]|uniref:IS701 family transposase n=1 Tax=Streptomyces sp. NPDC090022 TaxID=3365920 RepID=UPI00382F10C6
MTHPTPLAAGAPMSALATAPTADDAVAELCRAVFAGLPRRDQRATAESYVRALLAVPGRKSLRHIARCAGHGDDGQRLQHLISSAPWDWRPVRAALAESVAELARPVASAVRPATVVRRGRQCIGVDHYVDYRSGRSVRAQRCVGRWLVTDRGDIPVDWRLVLSPAWLEDPVHRTRSAVPEGVAPADTARTALDCVLDGEPDPLGHPVVLDARQADVPTVVAEFGARGIPYLLRVGGSEPLSVAGDTAPVPARRLGALSAAGLPPRRPGTAALTLAGRDGGRRDIVRVACRPADGPPAGRPHVLLAERVDRAERSERSERPDRIGPAPSATAFWLTDLTDRTTFDLLSLLRAARRGGPQPDTGLYAYTGRSFPAWHRHITLASVAHAAAVLLPVRSTWQPRPLAAAS